MRKIVSESGTCNWYLGRNSIHVQGQLIKCESLRVQTLRSGYRVGQMVYHYVIQNGVTIELVKGAPTAIFEIAIVDIRPGGKLLNDIGQQTNRIVRQCDSCKGI